MARDLIEERVRVAGRVEVLVQRRGSGQPVLYLHGLDGVVGDGLFLDRLAEQFEVIAPAHPGWPGGGDGAFLDDPLDMALHYGDLIRDLGLGPVPVVGWSVGGMFAAELAAIEPDLVSAVVLISSYGLWDESVPTEDLFTLLPGDLRNYLWSDPNGALASAHHAVPSDPEMAIDLRFAGIVAMTGSAKYLWGIPDRGLSRRLYRITSPTLIVWGTGDRLIPATYAHRFQAAIAGSQVLTVDRAGHCIIREHPVEVADAIVAFVKARIDKEAIA